jgi:hypothetical protein
MLSPALATDLWSTASGTSAADAEDFIRLQERPLGQRVVNLVTKVLRKARNFAFAAVIESGVGSGAGASARSVRISVFVSIGVKN